MLTRGVEEQIAEVECDEGREEEHYVDLGEDKKKVEEDSYKEGPVPLDDKIVGEEETKLLEDDLAYREDELINLEKEYNCCVGPGHQDDDESCRLLGEDRDGHWVPEGCKFHCWKEGQIVAKIPSKSLLHVFHGIDELKI